MTDAERDRLVGVARAAGLLGDAVPVVRTCLGCGVGMVVWRGDGGAIGDDVRCPICTLFGDRS